MTEVCAPMPLANLYSGRRASCGRILSQPPPPLGAGLAKLIQGNGSLPLSDFKGGVLSEGISTGSISISKTPSASDGEGTCQSSDLFCIDCQT